MLSRTCINTSLGCRSLLRTARHKDSAARSPAAINFENPQVAYSALPTSSLARALLVFKLCSLKPVVDNAEVLLSTSRRVLGDNVVAAAVRPTFFAQFCAGEDTHLPGFLRLGHLLARACGPL
ncbi:hypothetical protein CYMTET_35780 [Cymbomonas tetramitiformis]|uniref:Proline dehydrogenase n=1 Tax=Cymbomonas tetramitiformis TaxID=36881 RepID=A0AAE0F8M7_9CHLO|nr:hypothetical protein CYMTET_35780 [Cymbomonas tetramitiformis]